MKKIMLTIILSALLVASASACHNTSNDSIPKNESTPTTTTEDLYTKDSVESEPITNADTQIVAEATIPCNGNDNTGIVCQIQQNGKITLHIEDWDENRQVAAISLSSDTEIFTFRRSVEKAIAINNEHACLFLAQANQITIVSFEKNSPDETIICLDVSEDIIGIKGNFINENIGYLFLFEKSQEIPSYHAAGDAKVSSLFITKDGGKTWNPINIESAPTLNLREPVIFAKMASEEVGLISGDIAAAYYNFCERTLLTTDGGLNWFNVADLPEINDLEFAKITDFTKVDDSYVLTVRYTTVHANLESGSANEYGYATYQLLDLNTWIRIN